MICSTLFGGKDESIMTPVYSSCKSRLRFLIILDNDDFLQKSCWFIYSKLDKILQNSHSFPGKLEVLSYDQFNESIHKYCFFVNDKDEDANKNDKKKDKCKNPQKNRIYVRIPKERKYIVLEEFTNFLIFSQLSELNVLFLRLNTESVKIKYVSEKNEMQTSLEGIHVGVDKYIESMGAKEPDCIEIRFPLPTQLPFVNESKYIYHEKWKPIIKRRIEEGRCFDEYFFKYEKPCFLNETFLSELRTCGIMIEEIKEKEFELYFEIFYYTNEMICFAE